MKIEGNTRDEYMANAGEREADLRELDALIQKEAPDLKPVLSVGMTGNMLGYGLFKYKSATSRGVIDWPLVSLAAQKNYMSLYACAVIDGKYVAEIYKDRLGKVDTGKSCIRFKKLSDLDKAGVSELLRDLNTRFKAGEKLFGH